MREGKQSAAAGERGVEAYERPGESEVQVASVSITRRVETPTALGFIFFFFSLLPAFVYAPFVFFLLCFSGLRIKPWTAVSWHWFAWFVCIVMRDALSSGSP